jgi:MscS family membrane protein
MLEDAILLQILFTITVIILGIISQSLIKRSIAKAIAPLKRSKKLLVHRTILIGIWLAVVLFMFIIWGGSVQNIWISITGILGIIAIGFFAVWSVLSNIVCGIILLLIKELDLGDEIEIFPDKIKGTIIDVTAFYVIMEEKKKRILIPNNVFIQKIIKRKNN